VSTLSTHVLDTSRGRPASGVVVQLEQVAGGGMLANAVTDESGRIAGFGPDDVPPGPYRLVFQTGAYFAALGEPSFFPRVTVEFEIAERDEHYHVPLLLSPYGFTAYRGS
jgi:5-hydroxyisourate hydrolase